MNVSTGTDTGSEKDPYKDALDVLIDQDQRLFAMYDARRSNAETKAAGILTADVAIAGLTATAVGLAKHVNSLLLVGLGVLLVLLVVSVIFAIYTGAAAGLRRGRSGAEKIFGPVDAYLHRRALAQQHSEKAESTDSADYAEGVDVESQRPLDSSGGATVKDEAPLLSTESSDYRRAAHDLDEAAAALNKACDGTDPAIIVRLRALEVWRTRREDAHELAQRKDQGAGAAGIALGFALLWGAVLFAVIIVAHG